jgi:hypothetical protein
VFSEHDIYGFSYGGPCEKCDRMDEYIPALEKITGRPSDEEQESGRDPTRRKRCKSSTS